jgi:hypothetical protein
MIKQFKKEFDEIKNHQEHMEYVPQKSLNPEENFDELIKLTTRTNARFNVIGDYKHFIIQSKSNNVIIGISLLVILFFPTILLYQNLTDPMYWLVEFSILAVISFFTRYYSTTNNIEINTYDKSIKITSNNLLGRYMIPALNIPFKNFTDFTFKAKSIKGQGMTNHFNRVFICYNDQTRPIIDLPNGPFYYVNHRTFIACLTTLIKYGT